MRKKKLLTNENKNPVNRSISNEIDFDNLIEFFSEKILGDVFFQMKIILN